MQAFSKCNEYIDYINVIKDSILNDDKIDKDNMERLSFLTLIRDDKEKKRVIEALKKIDSELSYNGSKSNEMFKKINPILSIGELFVNHKDLIEELNSTELFTLVTGEYFKIDDSNRELLPLFTNKYLLDAINYQNEKDLRNNKINVFGISDYFFMIKEHFYKNPFDMNDKEQLNSFVILMISKMNNNTLHNGVRNMLEYWESLEVDKLKRGIAK